MAWIVGNDGVLNNAYAFQPINGFPGIVYIISNFLTNSVLSGFILMFILLGFYMLSKRKNLSVFLIFFLIFGLAIAVLCSHTALGICFLGNHQRRLFRHRHFAFRSGRHYFILDVFLSELSFSRQF